MTLISKLKSLNPLNLGAPLMNLIIKNALKKMLSSLLKGVSAALIVSLTAASQTAVPLDSDDKILVAVMTGFAALLHAAISGLRRIAAFDPSKLVS